jgi:putative resolvase
LLEAQGRTLDIVFSSDTGTPLRSAEFTRLEESLQSGTRENELVDDFVSVITSMAARIYGRRQSKRRAEKIKACVESVMQHEEEEDK